MSYPLGQSPSLTPGAVFQMAQTLSCRNSMQPIMQVIHFSKIESKDGKMSDRLKLFLSDGLHFISCMYVKTDLELVAEFCYVRVLEFNAKTLNDGRIIIVIMAMEVIYPPVIDQGRIGKPIDIEKSGLLSAAMKNTSIGQRKDQRLSFNVPQPLYNSTNPVAVLNQDVGGFNSPSSSVMITSPVRSPNNVNPYCSVIQKSPMPVSQNFESKRAVCITPIEKLNMYNNNWTIQGRVTTKSIVKTWTNVKGDGSLFSIEILDAMDINIRATFFNEAVETFYNTIEVSQIYTFSGGRLKIANVQYNTCKSDYEISFDKNARILPMSDEGIIPQQQYNLIQSISEIKLFESNSTIDLVAIIKHVGECTKLFSKKSGQELVKCDMTLIDHSNTEIKYTLWGDDAEKASSLYSNQPVVAIRRARVSEYGGGKSLGSFSVGGGIDINPVSLQDATDLHSWWLSEGSIGSSPIRSLSLAGMDSVRKVDTFADRSAIISIKELNLGHIIGSTDYLTIKAHCTFIKQDKEGGAWYTACPNQDVPCRNLYKVTQSADGASWECMKCLKNYTNPVRRWVFGVILEDSLASSWATIFNEEAVALLGMTADNAFAMTYVDSMGNPYGGDYGYNTDVYDSIFRKAHCQEYYFKCKVKNEINQETNVSRINMSVVSLSPVDYLKESIEMLNVIESNVIW